MTHPEFAKHLLKYWEAYSPEPVSNAPRPLWAWYNTHSAADVAAGFGHQALTAIATGKPAPDPSLEDALEWLSAAEEHWAKADELLNVPSKAPRTLSALIIKTYKQALSELVDSAHKFITVQLNKE